MSRLGPGGVMLPTAVIAALEALDDAATLVAAGIAGRAATTTSPARERAVLRLLGVTGVDREGRPLAAEVVDRASSGGGDRLNGGIAMPFAMALDEYDTTPQQLALDVASGAVDLASEARLLDEPSAHQRAGSRLQALVGLAADRIDANRVARSELLRLLGESPRPWIGTDLRANDVVAAIIEAGDRCRDGADLLRVEVPIGRELVARLGAVGQSLVPAPPLGSASSGLEPAPTGSQRGLTRLRDALDQAAAERGAYVRLSIAPPALAGPEGALVAAFERADLVELDPMADIITVGVDPDRAFADFAAAIALCRRADVPVAIGSGPLAVGPEFAAGQPADPSTRSGRALGLQVVASRLASALGLDSGSLLVGGLPAWTSAEPDGAVRAAAGLAVRSHLFADAPFVLVDPGGDATPRWAAIVGAVAPSGSTGLIHLSPGAAFAAAAARHRAAAVVAAELAGRSDRRGLAGLALEHAETMIVVARETVERIRDDGWGWILGVGRDDAGPLAAGSVSARRGAPDATAAFLG